MRRVYVTGIGVVSALGLTTAEFWQGLMAGHTGICATDWQQMDGPQLAARVRTFDFRQFVNDEKVTRVSHRSMELLLVAADEAVREAQLENAIEPSRLGVAIGIGPIEQRTDDYLTFTNGGASGAGGATETWRHLHPLRRLRHLPNISSAVLSMRYKAEGPCLTLVSGTVAGMQGVMEGFRMVQEGRADAAVCGGTDSRFSASLWPVVATQYDCAKSSDPDNACRPFDRAHTGIVAGEGAAVLVLEAEDRCDGRNALPYAELLACASEASPARGVTAALDGVLSRLTDRFRRPDVAVAHGDGSIGSDLVEAALFTNAPYLSNVRAITSVQAASGHTFCAAGALATAAGCMSIRGKELPSIRNLCDPVTDAPFLKRTWRTEGIGCLAGC